MQPHAHIAQSLERAWQHQDITALNAILSDTLEWRESPFDPPLTTRQEVITLWQQDLAAQSDINVTVTLLDAAGNRSYHRCVATWKDARTGARQIDALVQATLGPDGRLTAFTMWSVAH